MATATALPALDDTRKDVLKERLGSDNIAVVYNERDTRLFQKATAIASHLCFLTRTYLIKYDDTQQDWLQKAKEHNSTKFLFVGRPALRKRRPSRRPTANHGLSEEEEAMAKGKRRMTDVVVVQTNMPETKASCRPTGHYLERFPHLDFSLNAEWLAEAAMSMFAGEDECVQMTVCVTVSMSLVCACITVSAVPFACTMYYSLEH